MSSAVDDEAVVWDLRSGEVLHRFIGVPFKFNHVAFSPDGERVLTTGFAPRYWDLTSGSDALALQGNTQDPMDVVLAVAISPSGKLGAAAMPGSLWVWDLRDGHLVRTIPFLGQTFALRFEATETELQAVTDQTLCDVDVLGSAEPRCVELPLDRIGPLSEGAADGLTTAVGNSVGEVFTVNRANGLVIRRSRPQRQPVLRLSFSPSPHRLLVTGDRSAVLLGATLNVITRLGPFASNSSVGTVSETGRVALVAEETGDIWLFKLPP